MRESITLRLLGSPVLRLADGRAVELRQKAYALVALLYLDYRERTRRSTVAERLWEASTAEQAMTNLRQTLLHSRKLEMAHHFTLFDTDATRIELSRSVALDLRDLGRIRLAADGPELEQLVGLYRGELLADIEDMGPEFSQWLRTERTPIEAQYIAQGTEAALRIGGRSATAALTQMSEQLPLSEDICRARIALHLEQDNESAAQAVLAAYSARLLREMGIPPAEDTLALLRPRASATIHLLPSAQAAPERIAEKPAFVPRVVLLPPLQEFKQAALPPHLAPALIEDVTIGLTRLKSLAVIAPHTAWQLDPFTALDEVRAHQIDYAVESRVAPDFALGGVSIAIRLVRAAGREIVWADKFSFTAESSPEVYWTFVNGVARALADNIESAELARERTARDADAYAHYLAGRHHLKSFDLPRIRRGRKSLRLARDMDPEQASIESAIARTYVVEWVLRSGADRGLLDKAKLHAERAVAIDPNDGTAYRELGRVALFHSDLDASLAHMSVAADLAPNHADVLADYADTLAHNSNFPAARLKIEEAIRLNPLAPDEYLWTLGGIEFFRGRWEDALQALQQMRNQEPALRLMAATAAMAGDADLARKYRMQALELQPDFSVARWSSRIPQRDPADVDFYVEALKRAGFR